MLKRELLVKGLLAGSARTKGWVISLFSMVNEGTDDWKKNPYPYRVVRTTATTFFVSPEDNQKLIQIDDAKPGEPIFHRRDPLILEKGEFPNLSERVETSCGNAIVNWILLVYPFVNKIAYINKRFSISDIEKIIVSRLVDDPVGDEEAPADAITVSEYLKFTDAAFYLPAFTQLFVPSDTEKSLGTSPEVPALRAKLLAENKDRLHDPAVIAKIQAELIAKDAEWLKGDESEGFLIGKKARNIVRPKMFLMFGAEAGFGDGVEVENIASSLQEGWELDKMPAMINSARAGAFNRGYETQLGGEAVKWLLRISSNITVTSDDCGSNIGMRAMLTTGNMTKYIGFHIANNNGPIKLTKENISQYIGKIVMVRSPMYCRLPNTDYCKCCVGPRLTATPHALSSAVSDLGSTMMLLFMGAMHGKELKTARLVPSRAFS